MKILSFLLAATATLSAAAQPKADFTPTNTADSVGYYVGFTQGTITGQNINTSPEIPDADRDQYRTDFVRGVTLSLLADTTNTGFLDGLRVGSAMRDELAKLYSQGLPCNREVFSRIFNEKVFSPDTAALGEYMLVVQSLIQPVMERQQQAQQAMQEQAQRQYMDMVQANIAAGKAFMDSIKTRVPGIKVTPSGLAYRVIKEGTGPNISPDQRGLIYYTGTLVNGSQFDATEPGQPVELGPKGVIPGFAEALMLMNKGAHYIFYIPQELAYGMQGPPAIGPAQTLIFDVEVVDIH